MKTAGERLVAMSKDRDALGAAVAGELVGISRISAGLFEAMLVECERLFYEKPMLDYEECLVSASRHVPVQCLLVPELIWAEIDDLDHLRRARTTIYPRLAELETRPGASAAFRTGVAAVSGARSGIVSGGLSPPRSGTAVGAHS